MPSQNSMPSNQMKSTTNSNNNSPPEKNSRAAKRSWSDPDVLVTLHQSNIQKYSAHPPEELVHTAQGLIFSKQEVQVCDFEINEMKSEMKMK